KEVSKQRAAEAKGDEELITYWTPGSLEEAEQLGLKELDLVEAIDYYRTARGHHPNSCNKIRFISFGHLITFDAFHLAELFLNQPLLIIIGDKVGSFGSYRDGFDLFNKAASTKKEIHVVKGASHYDLYDQPSATQEALGK